MNSAGIIRKNIVFLAVYSIAMGFFEAMVVVYLRQLYYPEGFSFPLKAVALQNLSMEYLREISTVVMLVAVSMAAGRAAWERFSYFLYSFGIWDIFYYVWLKAVLDWPGSLLTWDVLFLVPVVWAAPVIAPVITASTMVIYSGFLLYFQVRGKTIRFPSISLLTACLGILLILFTFVKDYSKIIIQEGFPGGLSSFYTDPRFQKAVSVHVPAIYGWPLFVLGESLILCSLLLFLGKMRTARRETENPSS